MTPASTTIDLLQPRTTQNRLSRWMQQRRLLRDLTRRDRGAAQLAELHQIRAIIAAADALVRDGWVQHALFAHRTYRAELQPTTGWNAYRNNGRPVAGACLVGAITNAGGGLATVDGQPVQRAFDLTWHTLFGDHRSPVRYCPAPAVRTAHLRELIRWNDDPHRTGADVAALLLAAEQTAGAEIERIGRQLRCSATSPTPS
jgi:hypothetical protein